MSKLTRRSSLIGTTTALLLLGAAVAGGGAVAQVSDTDGVKAANQAYYAALSARDISAMQKVWASGAEIQNVGPFSKNIELGWDDARKQYEDTFKAFSEIKVSMDQPHITIRGPVAWVAGIEHVQLKNNAGATTSPTNLATSIFEKTASGWLMVLHHASRTPQ